MDGAIVILKEASVPKRQILPRARSAECHPGLQKKALEEAEWGFFGTP